MNAWPTPAIPSGIGEWVEEWVEELDEVEKFEAEGFQHKESDDEKSNSEFGDVESDDMQKQEDLALIKTSLW